MEDDPRAPLRGVRNPRARTITSILMMMLVFMIVRDVFARLRKQGFPA